MAAVRRHRHVAASQPGFLPLKSSLDGKTSSIGRRKRVNKNKKKNWNKYSDINDVEEFLDDVRLQERATGGLIADKTDESLFFVDLGTKGDVPEPDQSEPPGKKSKPLRIDLILQPSSNVAPPKDILAYQRPNAKKERRKAEKTRQLTDMGILPRRKRLHTPPVKEKPVTTKDPDRDFYDLWTAGSPETADPYYLEQTKKKLVKRPERMNQKPSVLPAVEVIAPGGSYNPDFLSHQALLLEAHEVEVGKLKAETKLARKLAFDKKEIATQESIFKEQLQGLVEEEEEEVEMPKQETEGQEAEADDDEAVGPMAQQEKKTEKQRKKEKDERIKELEKKAARQVIDSRQQLFKLRSIESELKRREQRTKMRQIKRKNQQEAQKALPRRLGKLKFQAQDLEVQLSSELAGSLRKLKPEGSVLKDRFKSLQKRNLIEPRERAKFKRKHKVKYVEKRAFKEIK